MAFKPEGYTSVAPYLIIDDARKLVSFLKDVFGAQQLRIHEDGARVQHVEVRIDDTVVMLADSLDGWPAQPANVHVYVKDVDATYQKALAKGARGVQEPVQKDDADKRGGFTEPNGIVTFWVGTQQA